MNERKKILLIEDNDLDAEFVKRSLKRISGDSALYEVDHHAYFASALEALEKDNFDIVLLDLGLPDITREESLGHLQEHYPVLPVVVLTGLEDERVALHSLRKGAQDFLIKGDSNPRELQRCIAYAIERHRMKRELGESAAELAQKSSVLQAIINHMGDGVIVTDQSGKLTLFNPAAVNMLDVGWMESPPHQWPSAYGVFDPDNLNKIQFSDLPIAAALRGEPVDEEEILVKTEKYPEGRYVSATARAIDDEQSVINGCVVVLHDITKRRQVELLKDEFVSMVSHELRTPLTSISGSLGLVLGNVAGELPQEAREMIDIAHRNSDRLVRLINDLLDIQKLEAGKMDLAIGPVSMTALVNKAVEANEGYASKQEVSFAYVSAIEEDLWVEGDEDRLLQVMANLLSNAAKFSPKAGIVTVDVKLCSEDKVKVSVRDEGPGIPETFQSAIFGKFTQADSSTSRKVEGTGLGLNICKSIIELHEGEIDFETEQGKGTDFYFILPLSKVLVH